MSSSYWLSEYPLTPNDEANTFQAAVLTEHLLAFKPNTSVNDSSSRLPEISNNLFTIK